MPICACCLSAVASLPRTLNTLLKSLKVSFASCPMGALSQHSGCSSNMAGKWQHGCPWQYRLQQHHGWQVAPTHRALRLFEGGQAGVKQVPQHHIHKVQATGIDLQDVGCHTRELGVDKA